MPPASDDDGVGQEMRRRSRRGFLGLAVAAGAGYGGWKWLMSRAEVDGVPWPLRSVLGFNQSLTSGLVVPDRRIVELPAAAITGGGPRVNGDIALERGIDAGAWRLRVAETDIALTLADLHGLPQVTQATPLNCIEGWTTVARWTGVRFADFVDRFHPAGRARPYVGLTTPDGGYYVGLDMASAMHPQTLLCYAINNEPLSTEHGAPLRLLIPNKYGIKNLKRVGTIRFADTPPKDYWAEQGYDWFAGL